MAEVRRTPNAPRQTSEAPDRAARPPVSRRTGTGESRGSPAHSTQTPKSRHSPWAIALTVTLATFMEVLDTSIANVALPHIAGSLSASVDESTWVLTSYLVSNAIILPMSAWLSTLIGRKRFYMSCVALFTISSFLSGLAPSLSVLIVCRVLQGAGGGGLQPSEQSILADTFSPAQLGMGFAIYGMAVVLAPAIGPTLGGWITDNYNWRWIFFINLPVGITSLILTHRMIHDPPHLVRERQLARRRKMPIDFIGIALLALTFGPMQVVLDKGEEDAWFQSHFIVLFSVISVMALILGIIWELYQKQPIVNLRLLKNRNFAVSSVMMFVLGFMLYGTTVLLPELVQELMGYTAEQAGLMLSPGALTILVLMPLIGYLITHADPRWLIATGFMLLAVALYHMTGINLQMSWTNAMMLRVYQSLGLAFLFIPINTQSYAGVDSDDHNQVSGIMNLMRNVGGSAGIALTGALVTQRAQFHQAQLVQSPTSYSPQMRAALQNLASSLASAGLSRPDATHQAYGRIYASLQAQAQTLAYVDAFWVLAVLAVALVPLVFLLRRIEPAKAPVAH